MRTKREIVESPLYQGVDERISYVLDSTPWGNNPTSPNVKIFLLNSNQKVDMSSTCLSGSPIVSGNNISTPFVQNLTVRSTYRLEISFYLDSNFVEPFAYVIAEE